MTSKDKARSPQAKRKPKTPAVVTLYRSVYGALPPRRIRPAVPGRSGAFPQPRDGATAEGWHCQPFVAAATYGLELPYPYPHECRVHREESGVRFEADFSPMTDLGLPHPFGVFAAGHYSMATALDLLPPPGYALRLEPHPRFFTDQSGEVPLAVPGHLQRFWPRQFFAVFKAPAAGQLHVFRPGEPYAQVLVVPTDLQYRAEPMDESLAVDRAKQGRQTYQLGLRLARHLWRSDRGHWFDDRYKQLLRIYRRNGMDAVREHMQAVEVLDKAALSQPPVVGKSRPAKVGGEHAEEFNDALMF